MYTFIKESVYDILPCEQGAYIEGSELIWNDNSYCFACDLLKPKSAGLFAGREHMFEAGNLEFDGRWIYTIKTLIAFLRIDVTCLFGKESLKCKVTTQQRKTF